jgi:Mg2+ and Co2+ transporter CorA
LDDITDSFASPIQTIEYEVDSIDELVLLLRENETSDMLRRIGSCRKNVMTISRLLMNKADVVRGLMKRFDERFAIATAVGGINRDPHYHAGYANGIVPLAAALPVFVPATSVPTTSVPTTSVPTDSTTTVGDRIGSPLKATASTSFASMQSADTSTAAEASQVPLPPSKAPSVIQSQQQQPSPPQQPPQPPQQPYRDGEILLYLGDILDHVLTMLQSLNSYEKILSRSHSNYLAQISLEINQLSNKTNQVVGTLTFFASLIVPMTFIAGLWG